MGAQCRFKILKTQFNVPNFSDRPNAVLIAPPVPRGTVVTDGADTLLTMSMEDQPVGSVQEEGKVPQTAESAVEPPAQGQAAATRNGEIEADVHALLGEMQSSFRNFAEAVFSKSAQVSFSRPALRFADSIAMVVGEVCVLVLTLGVLCSAFAPLDVDAFPLHGVVPPSTTCLS
jgi:hypothetical protein